MVPPDRAPAAALRLREPRSISPSSSTPPRARPADAVEYRRALTIHSVRLGERREGLLHVAAREGLLDGLLLVELAQRPLVRVLEPLHLAAVLLDVSVQVFIWVVS